MGMKRHLGTTYKCKNANSGSKTWPTEEVKMRQQRKRNMAN